MASSPTAEISRLLAAGLVELVPAEQRELLTHSATAKRSSLLSRIFNRQAA
jgi:hypothetical protein